MECNKEEAVRAMNLAEKKMQDNNFVAAQKLAQKAQRLYPEIENISRMLTVCEVHCSSLVKLCGSEMDWYKILQIEQSADMATIKKQYLKLAFQLHPDKNKFAGAEAAFKLIADAKGTLCDEWKRSLYDRKHKDFPRAALAKPSRAQPNGKSSVQNQYGNSQYFPGTQMAGSFSSQQPPTFWTRCPFCSVSYQYYRTSLGSTMVCFNCQKHYVAEELSVPAGAPPSSSQSFPKKKEAKKMVPKPKPKPKPSPSQAKKKPHKNASTTHVGSEAILEEKTASKSNGVSGTATEERDDRGVKANKQGFEIPKSSPAKPEKAESSKSPNKKRARKSVVVSSESEEEDVNGSAEISRDFSRRRSSRQKQNISYNVIDDDDFVSPPKRSRVEKSASTTKEESNGHKKGFEESSSTSAHRDLPSADKSESNRSETDEEEEPSPEIYSCPDPDFSDFDKDKAEGCFAVNQVWAIYDPEDGMPRFYARIKKVYSSGFKLNITWLEAKPENGAEKKWIDEDLPVACGRYGYGKTVDEEHGTFSHQMQCIRVGPRSYWVHPRKGETWAIFRDWDINWSSDPEKHKPFNLNFVEVLTDFDNSTGVSVGYLERVKGFVSIFRQSKQDQANPVKILPGQMLQFSHRIPSFQMTGKEREGVPKGSYELDPAALPLSFFDSCDDGDQKKDDVSTADDQKSEKLESEIVIDVPITRKSPRKRKANADGHQNLTPSKRSATVSRAEEKLSTPEKENHGESEFFKCRRSPRDSSKQTNEVNRSYSSSTTEKSFPEQSMPQNVEHLGSSTKPKSSGTPNGRLQNQSYRCDFSRLVSKDKFKQGQIWALRSNDDPFPRTYGLVKKVDSELQPHLVLLYPFSEKKKTRPVCCGTFKSRREKSAVYETSSFSHCVTFKAKADNFEIFPCKGEIWAVYKTQSDDSECDVVAVMDNGEQSTKVVVLSRVGGSGSIFKAERIQGSKIPVIEIPLSEISRFSHQIPATKNMGYWELDPKSVPGSGVICLD